MTATVTPASASGTVQFYANGIAHGSPVTLTAGQAILTTTSLTAGSHAITATYSSDANFEPSTGTLASSQVVNQATATIALSNTTQTYDGTGRAVTATTTPVSLTVVVTYTGTGSTTYGPSAAAPLNAGTYAVQAVVAEANYTGSTAGTLTILPATATISLGALSQTYDGTSRPVTVTTSPLGLSTVVTYTGTSGTTYGPTQTAPVNAGNYAVSAAIQQANYTGTATGTLVVARAATSTTMASSANPSTFGASLSLTATVAPAAATGTVQFYVDGTPAGTAQALTNHAAAIVTDTLSGGTHVITATYSGDANYASGTGTLSPSQVVNKAATTITLGNLTQSYDGTPRPASATTGPLGLTVHFTYTGTSGTTYGPSQTAPAAVGTYTVDAAIADTNYQGTQTGTLTIASSTPTVDARHLRQSRRVRGVDRLYRHGGTDRYRHDPVLCGRLGHR